MQQLPIIRVGSRSKVLSVVGRQPWQDEYGRRPETKTLLAHIFFYCKYLNIKKPALLYKKTQIFDKFLTVLLLLMLPFSEAPVCRCSTKQMFLKILQKHKKHLCESLVLIKLQVSRKRLRYRFSPVNFVNF